MSTHCVCLITAPDEKTAKDLAKGLVSQHLVACVNIVSNVTSVYWWQNTINEDTEYLLICKTLSTHWTTFEHWVQEHHPYDVPEIIQLPITQGSANYLDWITTSVDK